MDSRTRLLAVLGGLFLGLLIAYAVLRCTARDPLDRLPANIATHGAPPMVPHGEYREESCSRCHAEHTELEGTAAAAPAPHPERTSCRGCHVPHRPSGAEFTDPGEDAK